MHMRLLFITSHYFYQLTLDALERLNLNCQTIVVPYDDFSNIPEVYRQYQDSCDAVFVSGISAKRILELHFPKINKPLTAFQVDSDALHRDILRLAVESQSLDFTRVAMDFLLPFDGGCSVADFLAMEDIRTSFTKNQNWMHDDVVRREGPEKLILQRIVDLWEKGAIDCVVCLYSGNVPKLRELGIPCRCPFLSDAHLNRLIRDALVKIELTHLHNNHPSVIQIFPLSCMMTAQQGETLERHVREFARINLMECVIQRSDACCTLITSMQVVRYLTEEFRTCRLWTYLSEKLDFPITTGYGIGTTISHAMNNVQVASREAKLQELPFAMDTNGNLIGPLNSGSNTVITQAARLKLSDIARQSSLSVMTIQKILAVLHNRSYSNITTQELAESLNTTIRNANRIMNNLQCGGFATPVYTQTSHSRGRPVQVYSLDFHYSPN